MNRRYFIASTTALTLAPYSWVALPRVPKAANSGLSQSIGRLCWSVGRWDGIPKQVVAGLHRRGVLFEEELPITRKDLRHVTYFAEVATRILAPRSLKETGAFEWAEMIEATDSLEAASKIASKAAYMIGHVDHKARFRTSRGHVPDAYGVCHHAITAAYYTTLEKRNWPDVGYHMAMCLAPSDDFPVCPTWKWRAFFALIDSALSEECSLERVRRHVPEIL